MDWYKTLTLNQKINLKELSESICGIKYSLLKLKLEGFSV
jgi:hypothetical protein